MTIKEISSVNNQEFLNAEAEKARIELLRKTFLEAISSFLNDLETWLDEFAEDSNEEEQKLQAEGFSAWQEFDDLRYILENKEFNSIVEPFKERYAELEVKYKAVDEIISTGGAHRNILLSATTSIPNVRPNDKKEKLRQLISTLLNSIGQFITSLSRQPNKKAPVRECSVSEHSSLFAPARLFVSNDNQLDVENDPSKPPVSTPPIEVGENEEKSSRPGFRR